MNYFTALKYTSLAGIVCILAGCKIAVIVAEGGTVESTASGTCLEGTVCLHEITDTNYSESFTAVANDGWRFKRWNGGNGFVCDDSKDRTCKVSNIGLDGNAVVEAIVASDRSYYLMPIFSECRETGCVIKDTVEAVDKTWAQPDHFYGLSWDDINAVCPGGVCANGGLLNGYDMTGWKWASLEDFNTLLNSYGVTPALVGPSESAQTGTSWTTAFYNDGWKGFVYDNYVYTWGWVSDNVSETVAYDPYIQIENNNTLEEAVSDYTDSRTYTDVDGLGGWFYQQEIDEK